MEFHRPRCASRGQDTQQRNDPIGPLTRAFVAELNRAVASKGMFGSIRAGRERRIILFFDTFERLAPHTAPWLLDHFLEANISANVVLVVAGRDPIERSTPHGPKRWLPHYEAQKVIYMPLESFTEEETRAYLTEQGITDSDRVESIWHLSHGLPLYLGLLTTNSQGNVDPTKDVVDNFLRWVSDDEQDKRRLALDAALLSRPFTQDDLEPFTYISEEDRLVFYKWLRTDGTATMR